MGVIIRQSLKHSLVRYLAIVIGLLSTLFIYPEVLEEIGIIRTIQSIAIVLAPVALLGSNVTAVRFFPIFNKGIAQRQSFFTLLILIAAVGGLIVSGLYYLFQDTILEIFNRENETNEIFLTAPLFIILLAYAQLITAYLSNYHRIAIPAAIAELSLKLSLPVLILLYLDEQLNLNQIIFCFLFVYVFIDALLFFYLRKNAGHTLFGRIKQLSKKLQNEIKTFAGYNILTSLSYVISTRIDLIMLSALTTFTTSGIYSINMMIGEVIDAPRQAIVNITNPIIAEAQKQGDKEKIKTIYQKTSLHMLMASLLLFIGILSSIDELFTIMPDGEEVATGKSVIIILGIAKLIENVFGINSIILQHSKWYRFLFIAVFVLAVMNICNNFLLIPRYFMNGSALATLISVFTFNFIKFLKIRKRMNIQPFTWRIPVLLVFGLLAYLSGLLIPFNESGEFFSVVFSITLRSMIVGATFGLLVLSFRLSTDVNNLIFGFINRIRNKN